MPTSMYKLREDTRDYKYYTPTIILHVHFSNDVATLQMSDVTESKSDDCLLQSSSSQD